MSNRGPNIFLLAACALALFIVGGAIMVAKNGHDPAQQETTPAPSMPFDGEKLVPGDSYNLCAEGDHCIVVDTHCGFCCQYAAINAAKEQDFNTAFDRSCRKYTGTSCQCFDLSSYPSCVDGRCQMVPWPHGQE